MRSLKLIWRQLQSGLKHSTFFKKLLKLMPITIEFNCKMVIISNTMLFRLILDLSQKVALRFKEFGNTHSQLDLSMIWSLKSNKKSLLYWKKISLQIWLFVEQVLLELNWLSVSSKDGLSFSKKISKLLYFLQVIPFWKIKHLRQSS